MASRRQGTGCGTAHDITERTRDEEALRTNEAFVQESQRIARIGSYDYNVASNAWTSPVALDAVFGIGPDYVRDAAGWLQIVHPDDRQAMADYFATEVLGKGLPFDKEYRIVRRDDGQVRWVHGLGSLVPGGAQSEAHVIGTIQDVTVQRQAADALRASEAKYRFLVDHLNVGVFRSTLQGKMLHVNQTVADMAGYPSVDALLAMPTVRLYSDPADRDRMVDALRRDGAVHHLEMASRRADGGTYLLSLSAVLLRDEDGQPESILGIVEDITARKQVEAAQQQSQRLESLGVLAGGIAHDFNNLLAGLFGFLDLALETSTEAPVRENLAAAMATFARAKALTKQLLTFAKGGVPNRHTVAVAPLVRQTVQFALSGSRVACAFDFPGDLPDCDIDENQIAQVLDNLVINAKQAMPAGGCVDVRARAVSVAPGEHASLPEGCYVRVDVRDDGVGIPAEIAPRIFDPFFTTKQTGSGLGLAAVHSIVRGHGGFVDFESEVGKGTTFHVFLPASTARAGVAASAPIAKHHGHGAVLVMDDEPHMREVIAGMLESMGHTVLATADGAQALQVLARERAAERVVVAAIVDLTVPGGLGGKEIVGRLHDLDPALPVFAMSGYSDDAVIAEPLSFGFADSLGKPMRHAELGEMLARHLPQRP